MVEVAWSPQKIAACAGRVLNSGRLSELYAKRILRNNVEPSREKPLFPGEMRLDLRNQCAGVFGVARRIASYSIQMPPAYVLRI